MGEPKYVVPTRITVSTGKRGTPQAHLSTHTTEPELTRPLVVGAILAGLAVIVIVGLLIILMGGQS